MAAETNLQDPADFKRIFQDTNQPVAARLRAAVSLKQSGDSSGERFVVQQASSSPNRENRAYAVAHVTQFCGLKAVSILQQAMRSEDGEIWNGGQRGMLRLGPQAVPTLVQMLRSKEGSNFRGGAAHVLGKLRRAEARSALLDSLGDRDEYVANACFNSIRDIGFSIDLNPRFLEYLRRGTQIESQFSHYFCEHRDSRSPGPLLTALKRCRGRSGHHNRPDLLVAALEFQTGAHLGRDVKAWEQLLNSPADSASRAENLMRSGDTDGWLLLPIQGNRERLARELVSHLRLVDQRTGSPRWGEAALDRNGSALVMPYSDHRLGLLRFPELSEKIVTVPDVYGDNVAFSKNGEWVLLPGRNGLELYSVTTGLRRGEAIEAQWATIKHTDVADNGSRILEAADDARIWGFESLPAQLQIPTQEWGHSTLSPDGRTVALMHETGVTLIGLETSERVELRKRKPSEVLSAQFLADSKTLATWDRDRELVLWDLQGKLLQTHKAKEGVPESWSVSGNGLLLGLDNGSVIIWDGSRFRRLKAENRANLNFHGDYALTSGHEDWVRVWQLSTGRSVARLSIQREGKYLHDHAAITPDGHHMVTLGTDGNLVRVWRLPGLDSPDTDVPEDLLREQLKRATGRHLLGAKVVDLTPEEYQVVVRHCTEMEAAHKRVCGVRRSD